MQISVSESPEVFYGWNLVASSIVLDANVATFVVIFQTAKYVSCLVWQYFLIPAKLCCKSLTEQKSTQRYFKQNFGTVVLMLKRNPAHMVVPKLLEVFNPDID